MKIKEKLQEKKVNISFEVFPPKTDSNFESVKHATEEIAKYVTKSWKLKYEDFLTPEQLAEQIDLTQEEFRFVRTIEDEKGQKTFLRIFDDMSRLPSETEISAALRRLTMKPTKYSFITGHGERSIVTKSDNDYDPYTDAYNR